MLLEDQYTDIPRVAVPQKLFSITCNHALQPVQGRGLKKSICKVKIHGMVSVDRF